MVRDDGTEGTDGTGIGITREERRRYLALMGTVVMVTTVMMTAMMEGGRY